MAVDISVPTRYPLFKSTGSGVTAIQPINEARLRLIVLLRLLTTTWQIVRASEA